MIAAPVHCFDIGGSKIACARLDERLQPVAPRTVATPVRCRDALVAALAGLLGPHDGSPLAVAIAGAIDPGTGTVRCANIPCVDGIGLGAWLGARLQRRVHLLNDADAFALGCAHEAAGGADGSGSLDDPDGPAGGGNMAGTVFVAIIGTGIGGGIVVDGRLLRGARGGPGEWGHAPAVASRTGTPLPRLPCNCGQTGCVDTLCGARGLERLHAYLHAETLDSRTIVDAWRRQGARATRTVDVWLDATGGALSGAINLLDPHTVVVGGGLAGDADLVAALDRETCARVLPPRPATLLRQVPATGGQALVGAALHAWRNASADVDRAG